MDRVSKLFVTGSGYAGNIDIGTQRYTTGVKTC